MRLLAWIATVLGLVALTFAIADARTKLRVPPPDEMAVTLPSSTPRIPPDGNKNATRDVPPWRPMFGDVPVAETPPPPAPAPPAPPPPPPPPPPKLAGGYVLKGLVVNGSASWAIVRGPAGELMLREGDAFEETGTVEEISKDGVWITSAAGRELIAFE
ncbi:MAG: hypothetical protein ACWA47_06310 [Brevirhabdus sp.]